MNNISKSSIYLIVTLILLGVGALGYKNVNEPTITQDECNITSKGCQFRLENALMTVKFDQKPMTEEELYITFELPSTHTVSKAWIEGVNMYMGKTPIMFENPSSNRGITFLGSCNLNEMTWRMYLVLVNKESGEISTFSTTFFTYR